MAEQHHPHHTPLPPAPMEPRQPGPLSSPAAHPRSTMEPLRTPPQASAYPPRSTTAAVAAAARETSSTTRPPRRTVLSPPAPDQQASGEPGSVGSPVSHPVPLSSSISSSLLRHSVTAATPAMTAAIPAVTAAPAFNGWTSPAPLSSVGQSVVVSCHPSSSSEDQSSGSKPRLGGDVLPSDEAELPRLPRPIKNNLHPATNPSAVPRRPLTAVVPPAQEKGVIRRGRGLNCSKQDRKVNLI